MVLTMLRVRGTPPKMSVRVRSMSPKMSVKVHSRARESGQPLVLPSAVSVVHCSGLRDVSLPLAPLRQLEALLEPLSVQSQGSERRSSIETLDH